VIRERQLQYLGGPSIATVYPRGYVIVIKNIRKNTVEVDGALKDRNGRNPPKIKKERDNYSVGSLRKSYPQ
jgi:hypothetical protein